MAGKVRTPRGQGRNLGPTPNPDESTGSSTLEPNNRPQPPLKPKPERMAPEGSIIPTMGWPAKLYWFNIKIRRRPDRVPKVNKAEAAQIAAEEELQKRLAREELEKHERLAREKASEIELRKLSDTVPYATAAFSNTKGAAGCTATVVHEASVFADLIRAVTIVLDANPASGTSAARLGKDYDDTISIQQLATELAKDEGGMAQNFQAFISTIRPTRYSVRAITATSIINGQNRVPVDVIRRVLDVARQKCEYLMVDTANDITEPVTLAVFDVADVLVFTANVAVHDSLRQLATSMETLRQHGYTDKVNNSVVVISNLPAGADLDSFRKFLNRVDLKNEITAVYPFFGPFLEVPHDPEIALDREVNLDNLQWVTKQAYRELGIAMLKQVRARRNGYPQMPSTNPFYASPIGDVRHQN